MFQSITSAATVLRPEGFLSKQQNPKLNGLLNRRSKLIDSWNSVEHSVIS